MNDANYIIITKLNASDPGFDKAQKKFVDVIAAVLDTEVAKNEVKTLQLDSTPPASDDDDEEGEESNAEVESSGDVILLVKVTTK